jgi:rhodanese-related sulfurtransferase
MKKLIVLAAALCMLTVAPALAAEVKLMDKEALKGLMGAKGLVILDVRAGRDWSTSEFKIQGAERVEEAKFAAWAERFPKDAKLVLYCA